MTFLCYRKLGGNNCYIVIVPECNNAVREEFCRAGYTLDSEAVCEIITGTISQSVLEQELEPARTSPGV